MYDDDVCGHNVASSRTETKVEVMWPSIMWLILFTDHKVAAMRQVETSLKCVVFAAMDNE